MTDYFGGEPVRRVIFAEAVPLLSIDQRLIENFQDVALDLIQAETPDVSQDSPHERFTLGLCYDPVEEVAFGRAENAGRLECGAGEHTPRVVVAKAEHRQCNRLGDDHQKGMLKEQRVAFDLSAVNQL